MTEIWKHFLAEVAPELSAGKRLFLDLANPAKRTEEDILEAMECVREFSRYFRVTLGLNRKELSLLSRIMGIGADENETFACAEELRGRLPIETLVVHNAREAYAVSGAERAYVETPYCRNPRQVTGAGDNFNAGFVLGQAYGFSLQEALYLATASSGFYIRNCKSAGVEDLAEVAFLLALLPSQSYNGNDSGTLNRYGIRLLKIASR